MSKSSVDYAELAGLNIALAALKYKSKQTNEECIVIHWLQERIRFLEQK